jgi:NitT/TauT family transport system ATP-binding protein
MKIETTPRVREREVLLSSREVTKTFQTLEGELPVLEEIDIDVREGEILALLGRSGSGKSTLLRCLAGLIAPSSGQILYRGKPLVGANPGTAMVFQTFALLPWLTVQQNVELGLEAQAVPADERSERAIRAIDLIGLDGFESAYPKELSGGMRQRVGFARALVVQPDVLLMDEPFSALDVLTAENLRGELLELWEGHEFPTKAIVLVTHNIEEAVLLSDRVVLLSSSPAHVRGVIDVLLPRPRDRRTPSFEELVDRLYRIMTGREDVEPGGPPPEEEAALIARRLTPGNVPIPHGTVDGMSGLVEILHQMHDLADLADLADELTLEVDDLLPLVDSLSLLGLAEVEAGRVHLTVEGIGFAGADIQESKRAFAHAISERVPLVRLITSSLERSADGRLPAGFFRDVLRRTYSEEESSTQLELAIDWGRYAELYSYDASRQEFALDQDETALLERRALRHETTSE